MQHIVLKKESSQSKLNAFLSFLKGWGVDAEVKSSNTEINQMSSSEFTLNTEIWKDNEMSGSELRKNAWNRN